MTQYDFSLYPYPLNYLPSDGGAVPRDAIVGSPDNAIADQDNWYIICCNPDEMLALSSSVDVGAPIHSPDDYSSVIQLIQNAIATVNTFDGASCMDICQMIADCINDPLSPVGQAIVNIVNNTSSSTERSSSQAQKELLLGDGNNPQCGLDEWYGGCINVVKMLNINNLDALQILEVVTNVSEFIADVVAGLAGIEAPIIQSMFDWATYVQASILENYEAQYTQAYEDAVICDLFCLASAKCELTPQDLVDYFVGRLQGQLTWESLLTESLEFIVLGTWNGTELVDAMMLSQLVFRAQFGRWFQDVGFNSIDVDLRVGFNEPSDNWTILCTDCNLVRLDGYGFADCTLIAYYGYPSQGGEGAILGSATYDAENDRIDGFDNEGSRNTYSAKFEIDVAGTFKRVRIWGTTDGENISNNDLITFEAFDSSGVSIEEVNSQTVLSGPNSPVQLSFANPVALDHMEITVRAYNATNMTIDRVEVWIT